MALQDCPEANRRAIPSLRSVSTGRPLVAALCFGLGLALRLPAAAVVIILAGGGGQDVEQHGVDGFEHPARELVARAGRHHPGRREIEGHDSDTARRELGLEALPILSLETREAIDLFDEQDVAGCASPSRRNSSGRASVAPDSFSTYQAAIFRPRSAAKAWS
jgi:hypothetical protein